MEKEAPRLPRRAEKGRCDGETSPRGAVVRREAGSSQSPVGARGSRVPPWPLRPLRGTRGLSGEEETGSATSLTSMPSPGPLQ